MELAPLGDPALVAKTAAAALSVPEEPGKPVVATLIEHLKGRQLLLILDNCEHVVAASADVANAVLRGCPGVQILATSREGLGIDGEALYRVPSLSLPDPKQAQTPETLSRFEAIRLFVDRARMTRPDFAVSGAMVAALTSICFRLDDIPLAIELAAARARSLSVEEINTRLDQSFRLLTGGSRTALPRQQTLRSLIDWSYDLLNEAEKALLCHRRYSPVDGHCRRPSRFASTALLRNGMSSTF